VAQMNQELAALIAEAGAVAAGAERTLGPLTGDLLNWKRRADEWSVAPCLEHLSTIDGAYFPQFRLIEQGAYAPTWRAHAPWLARLFGDAFRILVAHRRRHIGQAERVVAADGFPKPGVHSYPVLADSVTSNRRRSTRNALNSQRKPRRAREARKWLLSTRMSAAFSTAPRWAPCSDTDWGWTCALPT
jgi:hypothetical protein